MSDIEGKIAEQRRANSGRERVSIFRTRNFVPFCQFCHCIRRACSTVTLPDTAANRCGGRSFSIFRFLYGTDLSRGWKPSPLCRLRLYFLPARHRLRFAMVDRLLRRRCDCQSPKARISGGKNACNTQRVEDNAFHLKFLLSQNLRTLFFLRRDGFDGDGNSTNQHARDRRGRCGDTL